MVDLDARANRLDDLLDADGLDAVWFARPNGFAWLTGGSNVVDRDGDVGVAAAGYDGEFRVLTDSIEAQRLRDEEVPDAFDVEAFPWYDSDLGAELAERSPTPAAADFGVGTDGVRELDAAELRQPLTDDDVERYRDLCEDAAAAVESVARGLEPGDTEADVTVDLTAALRREGIEVPVALAGGSRRAQTYRHYTPKDEPLGDYALLSVTAQREGLYASLTRTVAFDPPAWLAERHRNAARVEATALAATRAAANAEFPADAGENQPGTAGDVFGAIQDAYAALGWEGEWELHHQGGAAGFAGREWIATPDATDRVHAPMGYAWNPTVQGAKSEDTQLVTADSIEPMTVTGDWPTITVESVDLPGVPTIELERHAPL
ncbi:M24 family metallopeptidase [Salinarchaeum chitinilyticum]